MWSKTQEEGLFCGEGTGQALVGGFNFWLCCTSSLRPCKPLTLRCSWFPLSKAGLHYLLPLRALWGRQHLALYEWSHPSGVTFTKTPARVSKAEAVWLSAGASAQSCLFLSLLLGFLRSSECVNGLLISPAKTVALAAAGEQFPPCV